jgi:hypothetical protein
VSELMVAKEAAANTVEAKAAVATVVDWVGEMVAVAKAVG